MFVSFGVWVLCSICPVIDGTFAYQRICFGHMPACLGVDARVSRPFHIVNICCCAVKVCPQSFAQYKTALLSSVCQAVVRLESQLVIHALVPATVSINVCCNAVEHQHQGAPPDTGQLALEAAACPECCRGGLQGQGAA